MRTAPAAPLTAIAAATDRFPQILWVDRSRDERWLSLGAAASVEVPGETGPAAVLDRCRSAIEAIDAPADVLRMLRWFGGLSFDPAAGHHPRWPAGGPGRFVLPEILVRHRAGAPSMTLVAAPGVASREIERALAGGSRAAREVSIPPLQRLESEEDGARWTSSVRRALDAIRSGRVRKLVLSRDLTLEAASRIEPWSVVERIDRQAPYGVLFAVRFDAETAFLGATPERLFAQRGREVRCDCLAGTVPRGRTAEEERLSAARLLASEKDRREHRFVLDGILDALDPLCVWLASPASPEVLALPKLQHLSSPVRGWLRSGVTLDPVLARLHPTPAVGGEPRGIALPMIRELEGRARGWYAGPVGWVGRTEADLAVAIRSAILEPRRVTVFGGAGIVEGSDPQAEWEETGRKAASLLSLFAEPGW
jgi:menaquinone-specific isochorismate synthase